MKRCSISLLLLVMLLAAACSRDPQVQARRYVDNGNKFFDKNKFKEASIMYRRALQKDLRFGEAYYRLGLVNLKLGAYGDAAGTLRRAVELQPSNADASIKLAELYLMAASQDPAHSATLLKDAKDLADKLLQRDPKSFDAHRVAGQVAFVNKDIPGAIQEFEQANRIKPNQTDLVLVYVQALVADNRFPEAEQLAKSLIAKEKTFSPIYDLLYLHYIQKNRLADGEELLKLKIANNPDQARYVLQLTGHYFLLKRKPEMDAAIQMMTDEKRYPEGRLLAGDFFFFQAHEFDRAQQQYEAAIKAFPKDKAIYEKRLVELFASTGKNDEANRLLATMLKDNSKDVDAVAMRAALMLQTGNREQINAAVNDLQSLVTKAPQNHLMRFNLARALLAKNEPELARVQLEEAIKLRPDFVVARELMARLYLMRSDAAKALKEAEDLLKIDPNNLQGHLVRSSALLAIGENDKARDELTAITRVVPQNVEARYQVGYLAWQSKDYKKAEQVFGELHKANPGDLRGLVGVIETLASQGRMNEAIKEVQTLIAAQPERSDLQLTLANLYVRAEKYDDAIQVFQRLLDKDPKSADVLFRLGETQRRKGDLNQAIDIFRRASLAAPNDTKPLLQLGLLMDGTGKREQAKPIYEQILKIEPDHPVALNNLAFIKAEEGVDLDQALTMVQRALQKLPNSPDINDTLGWVYIKKNLSEDAVRVLRDLVSKDPKNSTFHYHYGLALLQKGDKPSAKRELDFAMKANPSKDEAGKIRELLATI